MSKPIIVNEKNQKENITFEVKVQNEDEIAFKRSLKCSQDGITYFNIENCEEIPGSEYKTFKLSTTDYIGIFSFPGNPPVIIQPKIEYACFFQMLKIIEPENFYIFDEIISGISEDTLFADIIINMFLKTLREFINKPIQKLYQVKTEVLQTIKGKVLISESLKKLHFLQGKLVCEYDIFTQNIIYNQIIKYTLNLLLYITQESKLFEIKSYLQRFHRVSLIPINEKIFKNVQYDRFTAHYKIIHTYCKMIIKHFSFGTEQGSYQSYSLLFNSNSIYERFLRNILEEKLNQRGYKVYKCSLEIIQPDIVIEKDNQIMLICDAKYKFEIKRVDYRQMLDYVTKISHYLKKNRDTNKTFPKKKRNAILIYPLTDDAKKFDLESLEQLGKNGNYYAYSINLNKIHDDKYLDKWISVLRNTFL